VKNQVWRYIWLATSLVVVSILAYLANSAILSSPSFSIGPILESAILTGGALYLIFFLFILVLRYSGLLFFSVSEHFVRVFTGKEHFISTQVDPSALPMVSIIVPAFNEGLVIQGALHYLLLLEYTNYEIIVVDDGSTDDTYQKALATAAANVEGRIRVITKTNGGKAAALNAGAAIARGVLILNMDGDTRLSKRALLNAVKHFDDPKIGGVAGNVKVLNRDNLLTNLQALEYVEGLAMVRTAQGFMHMVSIVPGPIGIFRKSVLAQVGGYDSDTYAEDCDLTLKILISGWRISYESKSIAFVESPTKLLDLLQQRYRWTRGMLQALRKHSSQLWSPRRSGSNFLLLWYMAFEVVIWPFSSVFGSVFFIYIGVNQGLVTVLLFWWLQLTILDVVAALYCIILEEEDIKLTLYVLLFRMFYIVIIDIVKVFAIIEECFGIGMTWGKLSRLGRL
jgi:biofilm PGA synthesis N-glycosyltransferase PgaC